MENNRGKGTSPVVLPVPVVLLCLRSALTPFCSLFQVTSRFRRRSSTVYTTPIPPPRSLCTTLVVRAGWPILLVDASVPNALYETDH